MHVLVTQKELRKAVDKVHVVHFFGQPEHEPEPLNIICAIFAMTAQTVHTPPHCDEGDTFLNLLL